MQHQSTHSRRRPQVAQTLRPGNHCRCQGCGQLFNSKFAFDGHRIGPFGPLRNPGSRRCLSPAEMHAVGMSLNPAGFWISETRSERQQRRGRVRRSGDRPEQRPLHVSHPATVPA